MKIFKLSYILFAVIIISGCVNTNSTSKNPEETDNQKTKLAKIVPTEPGPAPFSGQKGQNVSFSNSQITIDSASLGDNQAQYFNATISDGSTVYFFVVMDKSGVYRAAANACQVCHESRMGFTQDGDYMVCNTCGNKYPLEKIATEKGGCNPIPISPNLSAKNGKIIINQSDFTEAAKFF